MTLGRNSLGRKSRGTMLWSSDSNEEPPPVPPLPSIAGDQSGAPLERTESVETAIFVPEETESGVEAPASESTGPEDPPLEPASVPKDEIELLEESGALAPEPSVSPLPPVDHADASPKAEELGTADDGMEEVMLDGTEGHELHTVQEMEETEQAEEEEEYQAHARITSAPARLQSTDPADSEIIEALSRARKADASPSEALDESELEGEEAKVEHEETPSEETPTPAEQD